MFSTKSPIAKEGKLVVLRHNHSNKNIENIIRCNVINVLLDAQLLPQGEIIIRGSYDLSLCYSSKTASDELGCMLVQLHKRFEEKVPINMINTEKAYHNLQPVVSMKENPTCSSVIMGTVIESTVKLEIGIEIYDKLSSSENIENMGVDGGLVGANVEREEPVIDINRNVVENIPVKPEFKPRTLVNKENQKGLKDYDSLVEYLMNKGKEKGSRYRNNGLSTTGGGNVIVKGKTRSKSR